MNTIRSNNSYFFGVRILVILVLALAGCSPPAVTIKDFSPLVASGTCEAGKEIGIAATIDNPGNRPLTYQWVAEEGDVKPAPSAASAIYACPETPGVKLITLQVMDNGSEVAQKSMQIEVVASIAQVTATTPAIAETPLPEATAPASSGPVTLTTFSDGQEAQCETLAKGTYTDEITEPIWPMVYIGGIYHPQDEGGHSAIKSKGTWYGTVRFGNCNKPENDQGKAFQLIIVSAGTECDQVFTDYINDGIATGDFPGLHPEQIPADCTEQVRISIIRK